MGLAVVKIEEYGLIGNTLSAALISRDGSLDWLCLPHFDDGACFAALLGQPGNGHWKIAPDTGFSTTRCYRKQSAILETTFECADGAVTIIDFMPVPGRGENRVDVVRMVRCDRGRVAMRSRLVLRFDYGQTIPWVQKEIGGVCAVAGPDAIHFTADVPLEGRDMSTCADFTLACGESCNFRLTWFPSHYPLPDVIDATEALARTAAWWQRWAGRAKDYAQWNEAVMRSLITLKALTFSPTGAIVAAPTTSLPEQLGGTRNWDYRYCWIRDSTLTLYALIISGFTDEARDWRRWLLRAAAGEPSKLQIMYGVHGERRLPELTLPWLSGYESSRPVRIGNDAHSQVQLDVYGELLDTLHVARKFKLETYEEAWSLQKALLEYVEETWENPDNGIWEIRGASQHFTYSKIMAWVAVDRAVKAVEHFGLDGPLEKWKSLRERIHQDVCAHGFSRSKGCFTQVYGSSNLDASLLLMAQLGFIAPDDHRFVATVEAIERELLLDGLVRRYIPDQTDDGMPGGEGVFLACSFWLVDAYSLIGRHEDAVALFERLLGLRNDVGLLAEEYDPTTKRQLGNFPQAFSHIGLINSAYNLVSRKPPAKDRADGANS